MNNRNEPSPQNGSEATGPVKEKAVIPIRTVMDIVTARQHGRELAMETGFSQTESTLIATIISELARNIVLYAQSGEIVLEKTAGGEGRRGVVIISRDNGPGIPDVQRALVGGYSTSGGLGLGLCGVRRMVDEFYIDTGTDKGTTVTAKKWLQ
ncbi:MAG TPA: anti-sigma regulatory factor [Gammaproteobacteria bacterium]|nr:anti-sigma regulatory factor [Gammaproteobacteria bacterium]